MTVHPKWLCAAVTDTATAGEGSQRRRAWLHIGESKSGTTHIQDYMTSHKVSAAAEGIDLVHLPAWHVAKNLSNPDRMRNIINASLERGQDLLISSEFLFGYTEPQVQQLKDMLQGFDEVAIIRTFRERLARALSNYDQNCRPLFPAPFGTLMVHHVNEGNSSLEHWEAAFGANNIHLIDYYGVLSSPVDLVHVVLCEIAGYYCEHTSKIEEPRFENKSSDYTLLPLLHYLLAATGRKMCSGPPNDALDIAWRTLNKLVKQDMNASLPMVKFDGMPLLRSAAKISQQRILEGFEHYRWHHRNDTANEVARNAVEYSELGLWQMIQSPFWQEWLDELVAWFGSHGYVHTCRIKDPNHGPLQAPRAPF